MALGDICDDIVRVTGSDRGEETVPISARSFSGEDLIHALANELGNRSRPTCRQRLQTLVLDGFELDLCSDHKLACNQRDAYKITHHTLLYDADAVAETLVCRSLKQ